MTPPAETATWTQNIGSDLRQKLARVGLLSGAQDTTAYPNTLDKFVQFYIGLHTDAKANTVRNWNNTRTKLVDFFGTERPIAGITPGDADDWHRSLQSQAYAQATMSKTIKHAKQFFRYAVRKRLLTANPFDDLVAAGERNNDRKVFVDRDTIEKEILAAPNVDWRTIIALARYGGLRVPSELVGLLWSDIDWNKQRITFACEKTARFQKGKRTIPLFPELELHLRAARAEATDDYICVVRSCRDQGCNLRTQFLRLIERAGVKPWERLFQNLRTSRQTELADWFPGHVVADWLGNTEAVADSHYLQTTEVHFQRAVSPQGMGTTVGTNGAQQWAPLCAVTLRGSNYWQILSRAAGHTSPQDTHMTAACSDNTGAQNRTATKSRGRTDVQHLFGHRPDWAQRAGELTAASATPRVIAIFGMRARPTAAPPKELRLRHPSGPNQPGPAPIPRPLEPLMTTRIEPPQCDLGRADFEVIVTAANQGHPEALDRLNAALDDNPGLWQSVANLGGHCEVTLVNLIAGSNVLLRESLLRQVASMREELSGGGPGVLKEIAVQRVINAWLLMSYADAVCPAPGSRTEIQRQESSHRQFDKSVKALKAVSRGVSDEVLPRALRVVG